MTAASPSLRRTLQSLVRPRPHRDSERRADLVAAVREEQALLARESDLLLKEKSLTLRRRATGSASLSDLLPEAFALACEAAGRRVGLRPFDTQILASIILHEGGIAQVQTGEGKTLAAVLPAYLNALSGRGVHVLTFNDYLARRDAEWMGPAYTCLGLTVGAIQQGSDPTHRRAAYQSDVTYITAKEAGFDFLRDHLCTDAGEIVQRPFHLAIIDEADAILIDEARIPLVIAGSTDPVADESGRMALLVRLLQEGVDYVINETGRNVELTEAGLGRAEAHLGRGSLHAPGNLDRLTQLNCALHAQALLRRDRDYICSDGCVRLVDEFTGRVVEDRQWPDGLQAALEAKEGLERRLPGRVLGSTSTQHFLGRYPHLCGMTATAQAAAAEFKEFYGLEVAVVPPHRPCRRIDHDDRLFTHHEARQTALLAEIDRVHATGRPILVGTTSVGASEELATRLQQTSIPCQVLNARNDDLEARIIAEAGRLGAVTISTNMAGRGTDIRLGGRDEGERDRVVALGGLYVMGTCRHESSRIDRQLRGRAGRQGDPGSSRFFVSLEDDLLVRYGIRHLIPPRMLPAAQEEPIGNPAILREVARAQRIVEGEDFDIRRTLYDDSTQMEEQRRRVRGWRQAVLRGVILPSPLPGNGPFSACRQRPPRMQALAATLGESLIGAVEREVTLFHLDDSWSRHLARVEDFGEGIHLVRATGENPRTALGLLAARSFQDALDEMEAAILNTLTTADITAAGVDLEREGLKRPTSTWTYMVTHDPLREDLHSLLAGNIGFAAGAAFLHGPLIMAWGLYNRYIRSRDSHAAGERAGPVTAKKKVSRRLARTAGREKDV